MANLKSSKKDIRRTIKRRERNSQQKARLRTYDKKVRKLVEEGNLDEARTVFQTYTSFLDRAGKTRLIHPGNADRKKSRIHLLIEKAGGLATQAAPAKSESAPAAPAEETASTAEETQTEES